MSLGKISVKPFEPKTATPGKEVQRKKDLRDFILKNSLNVNDVIDACINKERISVEVRFNLFDGNKKDVSRYDKDLDNLLKIVLDVIPKYMDNKQTDREPGLGIIKNDNQVFEVHSYKKFTQDPSLEGIEIIFSEWKD